ncbi:MAG: glutamate-cysteine ligase family protein [Desulfobulbaceae bacterium]|nr:glutamate-cysteine ligase family protein [Desulfobulbaceae bacterium]
MSDQQPPLHLFAGIGIELEYMIVDRETLDVKPISDAILHAVTGDYSPEYLKPGICWSNELALHVIELKTGLPVDSLPAILPLFEKDIRRINAILADHNGLLLPSGAHPWMDPFTETRLWPHHYNEIYESYNRIFDCRGHGWSNLQSAHLNLPFGNDEEFGRLHAAIRLLLPILPALAASTPIIDGVVQPSIDHRLEVYRTNSQRIPSITGEVIPEPVFSHRDYDQEIFQRMYRDIAPHDPDEIMRDEWLNARGAIARFDRSAIEIRVLDVQECPRADLAIAALIFATLRFLVEEGWADYAEQQRWPVAPLAKIFRDTVREGEEALLTDPGYLRLFDCRATTPLTAGDLWRHILARLRAAGLAPEDFAPELQIILEQGPLARRIRNRLGDDCSRPALAALYRELADCLAQGRLFLA